MISLWSKWLKYVIVFFFLAIFIPILKKSLSSSTYSNFYWLLKVYPSNLDYNSSAIARASPTKGVKIRILQLVNPLLFSSSWHRLRWSIAWSMTMALNYSIFYYWLFSMNIWSKYPLIIDLLLSKVLGV